MRIESVVPRGIGMLSYQYLRGYRCCVWYDSQIDIIIYHPIYRVGVKNILGLNIPNVSVVS